MLPLGLNRSEAAAGDFTKSTPSKMTRAVVQLFSFPFSAFAVDLQLYELSPDSTSISVVPGPPGPGRAGSTCWD